MRKNGLFITFEGIDGCGKTTQALRLKKWLENTGHDVVYTFEPGDWDGGANVRKMLLNGEVTDETARLILFLGDRKFHLESVIKPALSAGKTVICDRYTHSTVAYQSASLGYEFVTKSVNMYDFLTPDVTFLLKNFNINVSLSRLAERNKKENKNNDFIESGGAGAINKIAEIYDRIMLDNENFKNNRIVVINADEEVEKIEMKIRDILMLNFNIFKAAEDVSA